MYSTATNSAAAASGLSYREIMALNSGEATSAAGANQSWLNSLINALMDSSQPKVPYSSGEQAAPDCSGGLMLDDVIAAGMKKQLQNSEIQAYTANVSSEKTTAAAKEKEVQEKLAPLINGDVHFNYTINSDVYEKMASDPDFDKKINSVIDRALNHPFVTADIPGIVGRSLYINEDGEALLMVMHQVTGNEAEDSAIDNLLKELMDEMEEDFYSVLIDYDPQKNISIEEIMRQVADEYWLKRAEEKAGVSEKDYEALLDTVPQVAV